MTSSDTPKGRPAVEPTMEVAGGQVASEPGGAEGNAMLRFTLVTGAWFVGLFGLMRLPWVERVVLTPFAGVQQRVADQLTGAPSELVYADASCSGGDPLALCAGAIFAFPATWGARLRGAAVGFTLITAVNVVRLGNLSLVAEDKALLDLLHVYVWPAVLILIAAGFVYGWMGRQGFGDGGPGAAQGDGTGAGGGVEVASFGGLALGDAARRFLLLAALLVAGYFATAPFFYESAFVDVVAGWIAMTGGVILAAAGDDSGGLGGGHPDRARGVRRHPGVHLHAADPALRGGGARGADGLGSSYGDAGGDSGRLLRAGRLAAAGAGRPGGGHRVLFRRHPCVLADAGRRVAGRGGGGLDGK